MSAPLIVRITHENNSDTDWYSVWTMTLAYREDATPFLTYRTGNTDEAMTSPYAFGDFFGYRASDIDIRHLY